MDLYISLEQLPAYAESTARTLPVTGLCPPRRAALAVVWPLRALRRRERRLSAGKEAPTAAERWLLDNLWLAEQTAAEAREACLRSGWQRRCADGTLMGALCRVLLSVGGGAADEERCLAFLRGFQRKTPLRWQELGLFPAALGAAAVELLAAEYARDTPDARRAEALFTTLRTLSAWDMGALLERADTAEESLRRDPSGIYPRMDETSRRSYRREVECLARKYRLPEHAAAERALELARRGETPRQRHIGYWLLEDPLGRGRRERRGALYILWNAAAPVLLAGLGGALLRSLWAGLLLWLPLTELVKRGTDALLLRLVPPRHVPRLELREGVPPEGRTLCVISVLLTGEKGADAAARHLEEYRMASRDCGENLLFGLLCDLPEAAQAFTREDRALLDRARQGVEALNDRYGGGFFLFSRERVWSTDTEAFAPRERKRGAVTELCRLLAGESAGMELGAGDREALAGVEYILTLDSDTRLEPESARALIGAALHPLNRPEIDRERGIVTAGRGLLHPRIVPGLESAGRTAFSRLFAPRGGGDPYGSDAGEVYMDAFSSGGFAGKGLIHVRAFLSCLRRLPERRVLSHDALEGAFLRGGYLGDVELTDGFPASPLAWFARQHRWVRGDWQNLPWLFRPGRELPPIERWRLWDSLRRSLVAPGLTAALGAGLFAGQGALVWSAGAALLTLFLPLWESLARWPFRPREDEGLRLRAGVLHGPGEELLRPLARLILLPFEGWTDLSAGAAALWRTWISGKNRLQWQTAEQSEAVSGGQILAYARQMWFPISWGVLLLGFAPGPAGKAAGAVWLLSPLFAKSLARPRKEGSALPAEDRDWLLRRGAEIWRYFREECRPETHFLPPDNVQLEPAAAKAERISPTNLGLTLIAALSALELGLAEESEALGLCENVLAAAERMDRWKGNFYNWYDTGTLTPLQPEYVSTVDSGNLWACLRTAAAGLRAHGAELLADRAEALCRETDLAALYDRRRHLFRIGIVPGEEDVPARSWYDLLESEERLTGYIAVASGQIPKKHWQRLGRAQVGCDGFRGMVSWSGTMFEYLMPELFLPLYRDSHLWESARFAVYVQRRRAVGKNNLWGMSESAFYALDSSSHYRYKAHGCPRLALCRGMEQDAVIAPYASFLALSVSPRGAVANLRHLETAGYLGKYGFWEAVDFTPSRDGSGEGMPVRCFMVHHLGMSLAAVANAACGGVLRRWFHSDPAMAAYTGLLQEKIPLGGALLRRRETALPAAGRSAEKEILAAGEGTDFLHPACAALSNGAYRLLFTESGVSRALCGGVSPYYSPVSPAERVHGLDLALRDRGERISLLPVPGDGTDWRWEFTAGEACLSGQRGTLAWSVVAAAARQGAGERRSVSVRRGADAPEGELYLIFEPVLLPEKDRRAHPSFARLGLYTREEDGVLLIRRLARGTQPEAWMAVTADRPCAFSSDLRRFPGRSGGEDFVSNTGWQCESRIAARVILPAGEGESRVRFTLAVAGEAAAAAASARAMLRQEGGFPMAALAAAVWGRDRREISESWERLRGLFWPCLSPGASSVPAVPRNELWKHGVSGDVPIHAVVCADAEAVPAAREELRRHALLGVCGVEYDLVFLTAEDGDYRRAIRSAMERDLEKRGLEGIVGQRGGVHFVSLPDAAVFRSAAAIWTEGETALPARVPDRVPRKDLFTPSAGGGPDWTFDQENRFVFTVRGSLPPRAWSDVLTGGELGWIASDAGTGSLWRKNARECPLIPWRGDPLSPEGPERLWAELPGGRVSFFARPGDRETRITFGFGTAVWEKTAGDARLRLTAFLPPRREVRVFLLESSVPCTVGWCAPVQLAPEPEDAAACELRREGETLTARNPRCPIPDTVLTARCSVPWDSVGFDGNAFLLGGEHEQSRCAAPALAGAFRLEGTAVLLCGTEDVPGLLDPAAARAALEEAERSWTDLLCPFTVEGGEPELFPLLNGWSAYQTLACRIRGRASLYQSGGAVGFRDQLQDHVNLLPLNAGGCRAHILSACAHQYAEGDVQHWWHPGAGPTDKGVRTRCSDDLLWLPWAVCGYVEATGDESILAEKIPFLSSPPLGEGETSRYETPERSEQSGDVLDHCRRAAELAMRRGLGPHRLLFMGGGDWNDGFDAMGEGAESVWLTFFASLVLDQLGEQLTRRGDPEAEKYARTAEMLGRAANGAWAGDRFLRGFYPDGTPLGGGQEGPCRVDSVAQSFAAFCPFADRDRVDAALDTALRELWDRERGLIRLYAPPVGPEDRSPGYVRTYGPGFRENGGQYTHAAVWLARACFRTGRRAEGTALLRDIARSMGRPEYGAEPFVLAADVSAAAGTEGRAGWSWYTGAAGWWYRTAREDLLGLSRRPDAEPVLSPAARAEGWRLRKRKNS